MAEDLITTIGNAFYGSTENLRRLPRNAEELATETQRLKHLRDDLRSLAENQARQTRGVISNQLSGWMTRVETLVAEADQFKTLFEDRSSSRLVTRYSLANNVVDLLKEVAKLIDRGNSLSGRGLLLQPQQPDAVQHVPSEITSATLVGAEGPLQQIKSYIMDEGVGIIGIHGMGGVGKTTLLKVINNEFLTKQVCRAKFDVAIWVTVSREAKDISSIQKTIASRLQIPLPDDLMHNHTLFMELRKKKFILLLDDVWERLDLMEVGIPLPKHLENRSKILFTTRYEDVCVEMDADEIVKVVPLGADRSWELFRSKFRRKSRPFLDDPNIQPLAKQVMEKCGGLPISLITVGSAMASRAKTEDDWRDAISKLDHNPAELSKGMEEKVLRSLKFSFDKLSSKTLKDCLLYLAMFPEDWCIQEEEIIHYWMCEGLLDSDYFDEVDIQATRKRGHDLIRELQNACLLEAHDEGWADFELLRGPHARLHDTVRDMALWIAGHEFVVLTGFNCSVFRVPKAEIWQKATRISLIENKQIEESSFSRWDLNCPRLTTLLLYGSRLATSIPRNQGFLTCATMPALKVIDLSWAYLQEIPIAITTLTSLQYLSLKRNNITSVPVELRKLINLRTLILAFNGNLPQIPREALLGMSKLQVLDMSGFGQNIPPRSELEDLKVLDSLCELHLRRYICSWELFQVIGESPVLRRCIREIIIQVDSSSLPTGDTISQQTYMLSEGINRLELCADRDKPVTGELELHSERFKRLHILHISYFIEATISIIGNRVPHFPKLAFLAIEGCGCHDLAWIGRLPDLKTLRVENCAKLTEILPSGSSSDNDQTPNLLFPKLEVMTLSDLPRLRSITTGTLLLPCLEALAVKGCPMLRRLPFGSDSAQNIQHIGGRRAWWDGLEWDINMSDVVRERFSSKLCK